MYNEPGEDPEIQKTPLNILLAAGVILFLCAALALGFSIWGINELHGLLIRIAQGLSTPLHRRNSQLILEA